jgi:predicted RNase H-like nuclease (RuvC/YqgF family)
MISIIIQQIVMDRRAHENSDDFASTFGMAVGNVIQNFNDLERLKEVEKEANELREQYEELILEKDQLQNEVEKLRILPNQMENEAQKQRNIHLKQENDSIRDVLKTSKETIAMLQERLAATENRENGGSDGAIVVSDDWKVSHRRSARVSFDDSVWQREKKVIVCALLILTHLYRLHDLNHQRLMEE